MCTCLFVCSFVNEYYIVCLAIYGFAGVHMCVFVCAHVCVCVFDLFCVFVCVVV